MVVRRLDLEERVDLVTSFAMIT